MDNYPQNAQEYQSIRERINADFKQAMYSLPPERRRAYMGIAARIHNSLYRPYTSPVSLRYEATFWDEVERQVPWQRHLRAQLVELDKVGNTTINKLYKMAWTRSPEAPATRRPSLRGWKSLAETIREKPEALQEVSALTNTKPINRPALVNIRAELASWL